MQSSLRKLLLLGVGAALPLAVAACGNPPQHETRFDGGERMSRPAYADFAPIPRTDEHGPSRVASGRAAERSAPLRSATFVEHGASGPAAWSPQPSWATADPLPLADESWDGDRAPAFAEASYREPQPDPEPVPGPGVSAGYVVGSLFEAIAGSISRDEASEAPRRQWRDRGRGWRRDDHPPRERNERRDGRPRFADGPRHQPPVAGAGPGRPGRPGPAPAGSGQSLPRTLPAVRVPAADLALGSGGPPVSGPVPQAEIAAVDREEIRAAGEAAHRAAALREAALQAASARREAEERQGRARQEEMQRQAARETEAQRARAADEQRLAAEGRRAAAEAQRLAAVERQARAAREQAANEARLQEQRQALALARRDNVPAVLPQPDEVPAAEPLPVRGPAARLAAKGIRPQGRDKPMADADLE